MMNHAECSHDATKAARAACRKAHTDARLAAITAQAALIAAFDRVPGNDYNDWLRYASRHFGQCDSDSRHEQAAAVLHYFATTDYQPTTEPRAIVNATLRAAS